jgi:diguanylate cyclase (GGDEF)-like protein
MRTPPPHAAHRRRWVALALAGIVLAGPAGAASAHASRRAQQHGSVADAIEVVQRRAELRRSHLAEVNELMLDLLGVSRPGELDARRQTRIAARAAVSDALDDIAAQGGVTGVEALVLIDMLRTDGIDDELVADPDALFETQRSAARDGRPPEGELPEQVVQLYDLMRTDSAGEQLLNDFLDAEYVRLAPVTDELMADYVSRSEPYIRSDGGYLGPDPDHPLVDSYVYEQTAVVAHPMVAEVDALVARSGLWATDQWIRAWQDVDDPGAPPVDLRDLADQAEQLDATIRAAVDPVIAAAWSSEDDQRQRAHEAAMAWFGAATLGVLLTFGVAFGWLATRVRRARERVAMASTDRLTGAGNRHHLDERTIALLAAQDLQWHLVAMIDMDRFKLINDSWGHATGDTVLIETASQLIGVVDDWRRQAAGNDGTVVRLGGDEFLLSLHGRSAADVLLVREHLESIRRSTVEPATGERLELAFSYGIATATGHPALDDLMRAADLAAYDEKSTRLSGPYGRQRTDRPAPAPAPAEPA